LVQQLGERCGRLVMGGVPGTGDQLHAAAPHS
jgi:hypothetical protein